MDTAVAEEYIEYYADKYKELTAKHKFAHKDGPFYADEVAIKIFLHDLEHFLTDIYHTHFCFE